MTEEDRLRVHPHERLAGSVQHIDLAAMAAQLRAEPHVATKASEMLLTICHHARA